MNSASSLSLTLALPAGFRVADALDFHRRDAREIAERVAASGLQKGLLWEGRPACLSLQFSAQQVQARLNVDVDAGKRQIDERALLAMLRRMLGLDQDVAGFAARFADHPQLSALIVRRAGLRVPATATPFEALAWAITGQQISVPVAVSLRRKLIQACNLRHASGLLCHPDAAQIAALPLASLRAAGFSATKAGSLLTLARQVDAGDLPLDDWAQSLDAARVELIRERLLGIRGIGPWTVNYALLRGFGWLDGSLHGDAAVRRGLQMLLGTEEKIDEKTTRDWLAQFSPWRALVAAHLWASLSAAAY